MSKKKSKKIQFKVLGTPLLGSDTDTPEKEDEDVKTSCILYRRLEDRVIPKADDGLRERDIKNPSPEASEEWYRKAGVGQYLHLEKRLEDNGTFRFTNRVQFEFTRMLHGYSDNIDERGVNPAIDNISFAVINKVSFLNNIANPLRYTNYFIEYFDDDDELMQIYFHCMHQIMNKDVDLDPMSFIENVYAAFTTDTMIEKIHRMVEYNIEDNMVKKADRVYDESIQLTIEHLKAFMGVSCLHKMVIPLVSHYYYMRTHQLEDMGMTDKDLYYYLFTTFIPVFDDIYDICLYNKLYHTSTTRITKTTNQESSMWDRRRRVGTTPVSHSNKLMRDIVTDISQKTVFSKSAIVFIHVCMDKDIRNTLIQPDKYDFTEMKMEASDSVNETMSSFDRWQTDKSFHSQLDRIRSSVSIKNSIQLLGQDVGLDFARMERTDEKSTKATRKLREEYEFYRDNVPKPLTDSQVYFIQLYYASAIGCSEDTKVIEFRDIIKLIMIMKRDLTARNYNYLPFYISGKVDVAAGKKYNRRRIDKLITSHSLYEDWVDEYPDTFDMLNKDRLYAEIKPMIECPITVIDYAHPEMNGRCMRPEEICAVDEIMRFMCGI